MVLGGVECRGFRNLADGRTQVADGVVVVYGSNGAGKTNLLEALYFGLTGRSFRAGNDRDMIRFGEQRARVELDLSVSGSSLLSAIDRSGERRHLIAGRPLTGVAEERPLVSVFHPDRLQLVEGLTGPPPGAPRPSLRRGLAGASRPAQPFRANAGSAERPGAAHPRGPGRGRVAALLGRATRRRGRAPDGGEVRGRRRARRDLLRAGEQSRPARGRDLLSASGVRRPRGARRGARSRAAPRTWAAPTPRMGPNSTRSSCASPAGPCGASAHRASSGSPCSPCSSRNGPR